MIEVDGMIVLGLTGEIASGKTTVAREFQRLGAMVIDADRMGHAVLESPAVRNALEARWGVAILDPTGGVDRAAVARRVFTDAPDGRDELAFLERVTHPHIMRRVREKLDRLTATGGPAAAVLDAALLFEAGWDRFCDKTIFVRATAEIRWARAARRGWARAQFLTREAAQQAGATKAQRGDLIIDNSGSFQQMADQVRRIWNDTVMCR